MNWTKSHYILWSRNGFSIIRLNIRVFASRMLIRLTSSAGKNKWELVRPLTLFIGSTTGILEYWAVFRGKRTKGSWPFRDACSWRLAVSARSTIIINSIRDGGQTSLHHAATPAPTLKLTTTWNAIHLILFICKTSSSCCALLQDANSKPCAYAPHLVNTWNPRVIQELRLGCRAEHTSLRKFIFLHCTVREIMSWSWILNERTQKTTQNKRIYETNQTQSDAALLKQLNNMTRPQEVKQLPKSLHFLQSLSEEMSFVINQNLKTVEQSRAAARRRRQS